MRPSKDPYYDAESELNDIQSEQDAKKMKARQTYVKRVIVHPSFHNISFSDAEKKMQNMDQGDAIVRPSSKVSTHVLFYKFLFISFCMICLQGADHLTVTWKVTDNIYQHIDIRETGKENAFSLGQSLWIGKYFI